MRKNFTGTVVPGMGGCVWFELYSVVEGLQVGVKRNERNVVDQ